MNEPKPPRSMMIGSWLAAIVLAAPVSYLVLRFGAGISIGGVTCIPGALVAGIVWGLVLWPSWRLGRRGFLIFIVGAGALHAFGCAAALTLGWGKNVNWGPSWTLGCIFEFYAVLVLLLFAALAGVWRFSGDKRVIRPIWLRPVGLAVGILLAGLAGVGVGFGLMALSENKLRAIMAANEGYLKAKGDWAPELEALAPEYIAKVPAPPWYLADHKRMQYGHLPKSTHYWLNWGAWQVCQSVDFGSRAVTTEDFLYAPREYGGEGSGRP